jgi:hypothetical protein
MHRFVRILSAVWFAALIFIGGTIFLSTAWTMLFGRSGDSHEALGMAVPSAMLAFGNRYLAMWALSARKTAPAAAPSAGIRRPEHKDE